MDEIGNLLANDDIKGAVIKASEANLGGVPAEKIKEFFGGKDKEVVITPEALAEWKASLTTTYNEWKKNYGNVDFAAASAEALSEKVHINRKNVASVKDAFNDILGLKGSPYEVDVGGALKGIKKTYKKPSAALSMDYQDVKTPGKVMKFSGVNEQGETITWTSSIDDNGQPINVPKDVKKVDGGWVSSVPEEKELPKYFNSTEQGVIKNAVVNIIPNKGSIREEDAKWLEKNLYTRKGTNSRGEATYEQGALVTEFEQMVLNHYSKGNVGIYEAVDAAMDDMLYFKEKGVIKETKGKGILWFGTKSEIKSSIPAINRYYSDPEFAAEVDRGVFLGTTATSGSTDSDGKQSMPAPDSKAAQLWEKVLSKEGHKVKSVEDYEELVRATAAAFKDDVPNLESYAMNLSTGVISKYVDINDTWKNYEPATDAEVRADKSFSIGKPFRVQGASSENDFAYDTQPAADVLEALFIHGQDIGRHLALPVTASAPVVERKLKEFFSGLSVANKKYVNDLRKAKGLPPIE
jgi:hypothetical protein